MKKPMNLQLMLLACGLLILGHAAGAAELFVAPTGSDANQGSVDAPLATLGGARQVIASRGLNGKETVTVHVADGIYYLPQTLVFNPNDSGSQQHPITYVAENEGRAILSGGSLLELSWTPFRDGIYQANTPPGLIIDQLFVNGTNQRMARYPNYDASKKTAAYQGFAADAFSNERTNDWADPTGGYIHAMHRSRWGGYHYRITGKKPTGEVTYEGGWQNNRPSGMHKEFRMVENIFEELDSEGEWFHDSDKQVLFYKPSSYMDLPSARIEVVRLQHLIEFQGSVEAPVKYITLQGFVVRHAARTFMDTKEPLLRSDWAIYRGGAFFLTGTEDVQILDTEFDQVGGNAIFVNNYNRRTRIDGCHIHDVGASGVCFVGDPNAVRDPCFRYGEKNDLTKIDRTPGPKTENYPAEGIVSDCLIHGIGRVERQPAGVQISMAMGITLADTSVYDCARAGINIGDGCWGGHLIDRCDVFDTVLETHDHGSFNSWGRDRFWHSDRSASQAVVDQEPDLPFLDANTTTVIRNSRWRCDHGWDIDLDDGSSNYDIYNNLMLAGGLKLREGFRRRAWNNITVNNGFHPHVWYNHSEDEVFGNIFMRTHQGARMPSHKAKGKRVDGNLFYTSDVGMKDRFIEFAWDVNSMVADPGFVDPESGDFRVKEGSPAFDIGFKNFPMDQFGVKKQRLRKIASTPIIPEVEVLGTANPARRDSAPPTEKRFYWLGAKMDSLKGEEFSAFGVGKESGGVVVSKIPAQSDAAKLGLRDGDLLQGLNGHVIKNVDDLLQASLTIADAPISAKVIRNQQAVELKASDLAFSVVEAVDESSGFSQLAPKPQPGVKVSAAPATRNQPLSILTDGKLVDDYGPVFSNGTRHGSYRMDLGRSQSVSAITSWSTNHSGRRGPQQLTLFGSNAQKDPGWAVADASTFTPLGTIDTTSRKPGNFNAVSLRSRPGHSLGTFRWIYWRVKPVTQLGENTAFQEFHIETTVERSQHGE